MLPCGFQVIARLWTSLAMQEVAYMIYSSRNAVLWLIFTQLDYRCILQLDLKVMPCVVECLHEQTRACLLQIQSIETVMH